MQSLRKTISDNEQEMRPADSGIDSPGNMQSVSVNVSQIKKHCHGNRNARLSDAGKEKLEMSLDEF